MTYALRFALPFAAAGALLTGCSSAEKGAQDAVRGALKDPESARFGAFYYNNKTGKGCLTVNAKNSMGGYTGNQQAYVERTDSGWESIGIVELSPDSCREVHADQPRTKAGKES